MPVPVQCPFDLSYVLAYTQLMLFLALVAMLGAAQGLLLLILIGVRFRSRNNLPFALLLLGFSLRLSTIPAWNPDTLLSHSWILTVIGPMPLLFAPLVWWYVRELVHENETPRRVGLHCLPWIIETALLSVFVYSMSAVEYRALVVDLFSSPSPWWMPVRHALKLLQGLVYALPTLSLAFGAASRNPHVTPRRLLWARFVVLAPLLSLLAFSVVAVRPAAAAVPLAGSISPFYVPAAVMAVTIYSFAMLVIAAPDVLSVAGNGQSSGTAQAATQEEIEDIAYRVRRALDAGAYRNPELTISSLAKQLKVHPKRLSYAINQGFGQNFSQLVHSRRLNYFLQQAAHGIPEQQTILRIAIDAGFPSKSTFNRVFKQRFGKTPSEFLPEYSLTQDET
ncbi:MAG: AraC family transcriptional regulator [Spirochaetaceae bacterium]|nr:MAG: AraC family transcriptional regulator [Spirochaetaceae bacterium]